MQETPSLTPCLHLEQSSYPYFNPFFSSTSDFFVSGSLPRHGELMALDTSDTLAVTAIVVAFGRLRLHNWAGSRAIYRHV